MEKRLKTPDLFKFPFFEAICWFVAKNLLETLKGNPCFVSRDVHVSTSIFFLFIDSEENYPAVVSTEETF